MQAANESVATTCSSSTRSRSSSQAGKKRVMYGAYPPKLRAKIGHYAQETGNAACMRQQTGKYGQSNAREPEKRRNHRANFWGFDEDQPVVELHPMLGKVLDSKPSPDRNRTIPPIFTRKQNASQNYIRQGFPT